VNARSCSHSTASSRRRRRPMANRWNDGNSESVDREKRKPQMVQLIELAAPLQIFVEPQTYRLMLRRKRIADNLSFTDAMTMLAELTYTTARR
jgi:hypothetical protein